MNNNSNDRTKLEDWLHAERMTIADLARELGYTYPYLWNMVRGRSVITGPVIDRFCERFGADTAAEVFGNGSGRTVLTGSNHTNN